MKRNLYFKWLFASALLCMGVGSVTAGGKKTVCPEAKNYLYRITLADKDGTPFKIGKPEKYLSVKAIERRKRQGLAVDSTDLPLSPKYVKAIAKAGHRIVGRSKWNNTLLIQGADSAKMEGLISLPFVKEVKKVWRSPDSIAVQERESYASELVLPKSDKAASYYGVADYQIGLLNGKPLHDAGFRGQGITIAVFDGGFMNVDKIPAFQNVRILGTRDFVYPRCADVFTQPDHGTAVLSCIATNQPGMYVGTAPEAEFWLMRCEDVQIESLAEEDFWTMAAEFADSVGVDLISSSLGYTTFDDPSMNHRYAEQTGRVALNSRTASKLASKGIVLVNSAGNLGMGTWKKINFPSDAFDILSVGALSPDKVNARFSSIGPTDDGRINPDVMSLGNPGQTIDGSGKIAGINGTSFACPILAGMVACLRQALPDLPAKDIVELVRRAGDNYSTPNNIFGYGIPDFYKAYQLGLGGR